MYLLTCGQTSTCVGDAIILTDDLVEHWKNDYGVFSNDVMEPILPADGSAKVSYCTATAITDLRDTYSLYACQTTSQCASGFTCVGTQDNLVGLCIHGTSAAVLPRSNKTSVRVHQFPPLTAFVGAFFTLLQMLVGCASKRPKSRAAKSLRITRP